MPRLISNGYPRRPKVFIPGVNPNSRIQPEVWFPFAKNQSFLSDTDEAPGRVNHGTAGTGLVLSTLATFSSGGAEVVDQHVGYAFGGVAHTGTNTDSMVLRTNTTDAPLATTNRGTTLWAWTSRNSGTGGSNWTWWVDGTSSDFLSVGFASDWTLRFTAQGTNLFPSPDFATNATEFYLFVVSVDLDGNAHCFVNGERTKAATAVSDMTGNVDRFSMGSNSLGGWQAYPVVADCGWGTFTTDDELAKWWFENPWCYYNNASVDVASFFPMFVSGATYNDFALDLSQTTDVDTDFENYVEFAVDLSQTADVEADLETVVDLEATTTVLFDVDADFENYVEFAVDLSQTTDVDADFSVDSFVNFDAEVSQTTDVEADLETVIEFAAPVEQTTDVDADFENYIEFAVDVAQTTGVEADFKCYFDAAADVSQTVDLYANFIVPSGLGSRREYMVMKTRTNRTMILKT